jgi:Protein of unknown function (DUF2905)
MTPLSAGPLIVIIGLIVVLLGLAVWAGAFGWFGRLPGDIRLERDTVRVYIPIVSMLLLSLVLSLVLYLINRFL